VSAISPPERAGLANTLVPRDLSRGDGILGSSGLPKLISGHILSQPVADLPNVMRAAEVPPAVIETLGERVRSVALALAEVR
jgi:hypothetical protein